MVDVRVRLPVSGDGDDIARAHIQAWKVGYAEMLPAGFLAELDEIERGLAWEDRLRAHRRRPEQQSHEFLVAEIRDNPDDEYRLVGISTIGAERDAGGEPAPGREPGRDVAREVGDVGEVWMINVLPAAWGCGVGSHLLAAAQARLAEEGFGEAVLWVLAANGRARRFYERHGWSADGEQKIETFGGRDVEELRYRRRL